MFILLSPSREVPLLHARSLPSPLLAARPYMVC
jgi:hypothetical protein